MNQALGIESAGRECDAGEVAPEVFDRMAVALVAMARQSVDAAERECREALKERLTLALSGQE